MPSRKRYGKGHGAGRRNVAISGHDLLSGDEWSAVAESLDLSGREVQIMQLVCDDLSEAGIADRLAISAHTVHTHVERLRHKLRAHSRSGLIVRVFAEHRAIARLGDAPRAEAPT